MTLLVSACQKKTRCLLQTHSHATVWGLELHANIHEGCESMYKLLHIVLVFYCWVKYVYVHVGLKKGTSHQIWQLRMLLLDESPTWASILNPASVNWEQPAASRVVNSGQLLPSATRVASLSRIQPDIQKYIREGQLSHNFCKALSVIS